MKNRSSIFNLNDNTKEIGGFIDFEKYHGPMLYDDGIKLNSAQNCLRYLIRELNIHTIWIPYFLCGSVSDGCRKENISVHYYHINPDFSPQIPESLHDEEWFYVVNYYGQLQDEILLDIHSRHSRLILDNVQAYFHCGFEGIPTIYSCRKFFGLTDGGILTKYSGNSSQYGQDYSYDRMFFLMGRFEKGAKDFYKSFACNDEMIGNSDIKRMSALTENILHSLDYSRIRKSRERNFMTLHERLKDRNKLNLFIPSGPFMYPLYVENGGELRSRLIQKNIFVPKLWPLDYHGIKDLPEIKLAENIVPLPCDQRYSQEDMEYIAESVEIIESR